MRRNERLKRLRIPAELCQDLSGVLSQRRDRIHPGFGAEADRRELRADAARFSGHLAPPVPARKHRMVEELRDGVYSRECDPRIGGESLQL